MRNDPLKVVQINSSCEFGSTGRITVEISKKLDARGIENYIFYSGNRKSQEKNGVLINSKLSIRVHQFLSRILGDQGWHSYFSTRRLVRRLNKIMPDIIHLHNLHGYYLHIGVLFSYLSNTNAKIIWTLHDCWAFTGHCAHFTGVECDKWKEHCGDCPQKKEYPYSCFWDRSSILFERKKRLYNAVPNMTITTVSEWLGNVTAQSKLLQTHNICVIPNGVDIQIFRPRTPLKKINNIDISNKQVILGVANVWSDRKGLSDFKKLSCMISNDFVIVLVGVKKEQQIDMPRNIICVERTASVAVLAELYSTASVYFNASIEETFGLTTIEAMACGTPVITYQSTACAEPVTSNTGIVVNPKDLEGVWLAIQKICSEGKNHFFDACREHVIQKYTAERIYTQYVDLYFDRQERINA